MISIDLATRFLWEDHQVFVLHPGKSKKFYGDFISQNRVFLDFPGVRLPRDIDIASSEFRATLRMGREIARWYTARDSVGKEPSRDFRDHLPKSGKFGRARYANEAEGLYSKAKRGDLVICPGPGYRTHVYIGEFVEDFDRRVVAHAEIYEHEPIPARRVTWLSSSQTKAQFSDRLIQLMQNPAALIQIASYEEKQEVYDLAYGDYTLPNQGVGRVLITKEHIDLHDLNESSEVISYFVAMFRAQDQQQLEAFFKLRFWDAIDNFYDRSYLVPC